MTNWINRAASLWPFAGKPASEQKQSRAEGLISLHHTGQPVWSPRNYEAFAREGFSQNAIGYRCVKMIAEAAASIPWQVHDNGVPVSGHPLERLLSRPNPADSGRALMEAFYGYLQVSGNAYLEAAMVDGKVRELYALRPDRMKVIAGDGGWPAGFEYRVNGASVRFDQSSGPVAPILHMTLFNPLNDYYGMAPFEAAAKAIDIHNAAAAWNKALLDNAARPSGALVYANKDGDGNLTGEQFERLKAELEGAYQGAQNAGRPMVLEGGLDWKQMSYSPKDMEHIEARHVAAREIALAFGIPPMLLGIPGDNTFANYAEANRTFWRQTVIPLAEKTALEISNWLAPVYGRSVRIMCETDNLTALAGERQALWQRINDAHFLDDDEKRQLLGLAPRNRRTNG
ncbi:MAG TPA: phage portal protein [Rhizobiales bacterium]|nr:phage portal protein [Hyphomicrobiales bacterium]